MAKADLGTKRICPETGKKFYDLNKDPIVSPFTGIEYPLSHFEEVVKTLTKKAPKPETETEEDTEAEAEEESEDEIEDDEDAPELDEEPIDLGGDDEDDDTPVAKRATPADDDLDGFTDGESDLDDDDDDGVLLDDDDDDDIDLDADVDDED